MKNLDALNQERGEILARLQKAMQDNDTEATGAAFAELADVIAQRLMVEAQVVEKTQDASVLASRGIRQLTSEEKKYYEKVIEAMRSSDPKQALANLEAAVPETVINEVFEDMRHNHPLLNEIDFQNTGLLTRWLLETAEGQAVWGPVSKAYTEDDELSASFAEVDLTMNALTAWLPVKRYMLDLGPEWLDRFVRELLSEALATRLEWGVVAGNGKAQPIGMMKKLSGATDGVYPDKTAVPVDELTPEAFGALLNTLSTGANGKRRTVGQVIMVVNPADYFTKVFPATTVRTTDGRYANDVLPYPTRVIQSEAVPAGKAIIGIGRKYFMGLGTQKGGRIEVDSSVRFLDREVVYAIFLYGNGRAKDENAFIVLDISGMKGTALNVYVTNAAEFPSGEAANGEG